MAETNYPTLLSIAGIANLKIVSIGAPVISQGSIDVTHMASPSGWREYMVDSLKSAASFSVGVETAGQVMADLFDVWALSAPVACVFTENGIPAWSFNGLITSFDAGSADAKSPAEEIVTLTIQPTGVIADGAVATNWYDDVVYIFTDVGGAYTTPAVPGTHQLIVYGVILGLPAFALSAVQIAACTFASTVGAKATVSAAGLITAVASGATVISVDITAKPTVETVINVTVP